MAPSCLFRPSLLRLPSPLPGVWPLSCLTHPHRGTFSELIWGALPAPCPQPPGLESPPPGPGETAHEHGGKGSPWEQAGAEAGLPHSAPLQWPRGTRGLKSYVVFQTAPSAADSPVSYRIQTRCNIRLSAAQSTWGDFAHMLWPYPKLNK